MESVVTLINHPNHVLVTTIFYVKGIRGHPSKTSGPKGRGGQPKMDDHRRVGGVGDPPLNRTSISDDFEQIFCVSDSDDTPPPLSRSAGSKNMLRFERFLRDRGRTSGDEGGRWGVQMDDVGQGGGWGQKVSFWWDVFDG